MSGKIITINESNFIEMEWRLAQWKPDDHYSVVKINFEQKDSYSLINLEQNYVPKDFVENTKEGWERYYFRAIKSAFGYSTGMFD